MRVRASLGSRGKDKIIKLVMSICQMLLAMLLLLLFFKMYDAIFVIPGEFFDTINYLIQTLIYASPFLIVIICLTSKYRADVSDGTKPRCTSLPKGKDTPSIGITKLSLIFSLLIGVFGSFLLWFQLNRRFFHVLGENYYLRTPETFGLSLVGIIVVFIFLLLCNLMLSNETRA
jgi:hypothetical protein